MEKEMDIMQFITSGWKEMLGKKEPCGKCESMVNNEDYVIVNGLCRACNNQEYGDAEKGFEPAY